MHYGEAQEQAAFLIWFKSQYPHYALNIFHIPNGQNVGVRTGLRMKKLGLLKGAPDLFIAVPTIHYSGLFIEMKDKKGCLRASQKLVIDKLEEHGYCVNVCYGAHEAIESTQHYFKRTINEA